MAGRQGRHLYLLTALLLVPAAAHVAFSSLGFNPTDDGFILAMSRRLLDGQVPHRDFISIRPAGSPLLHTLTLLAGGWAPIWCGRAVAWLEFAFVSWAWIEIACRMLEWTPGSAVRFVLFITSFALSTHNFPAMPWHTVDGLVLSALGTLLLLGEGRARCWSGAFALGAAVLCKQNFAVVVPAGLVLTGRHREVGAWISAVLPACLYAAVIAAAGGAGAAARQLLSQHDLLSTGVYPYLRTPFLYGGVVTGLLIGALARSRKGAPARWLQRPHAVLAAWLAAAAVVGAFATLRRYDFAYLNHAVFALFGIGLGILAISVRGPAAWTGTQRLLAMTLVTAWAATVSIGYRTPALFAGSIAAAVFAIVLRPMAGQVPRPMPAGAIAASVVTALAVLPMWAVTRLDHIYNEQPANALTERLDAVFPAARRIRTDPSTYDMLSDLARAIRLARHRPVAILTDYAAYWISSPEPNPLPCDWPQAIELSSPQLQLAFLKAIDAHRGRTSYVVQRAYATGASIGFSPIGDTNPYYFACNLVRARYRKVSESRWFEVFE